MNNKRVRVVMAVTLAIVAIAVGASILASRNSNATSNAISKDGKADTYPKAGKADIYPDPQLSPGAVDPRVTQGNIKETICVPGYTKTVRPSTQVTRSLKKQLLAQYKRAGMPAEYELDHIIPLELGGCPDCVSNLWPEPFLPLPGAREKDRVENSLHRQVCSGATTLEEAQQLIASDWYHVYVEIR